MLRREHDAAPAEFVFDISIVAIGYEGRCRWVSEQHEIRATTKLGFEFGFLATGAFEENRAFFAAQGYQLKNGLHADGAIAIANAIRSCSEHEAVRVFLDISSMSREMIANVVAGLDQGRAHRVIEVTCAYAPSKFSSGYGPAPIRVASPIKPILAGWSSRPEKPLGAIFGLGCEPGLALGALQVLEPDKAWTFQPVGFDHRFAKALDRANEHLTDIFDVTEFEYQITEPSVTRGRFEALLNAVEDSFRIIAVPFGPKMFAWLVLSTVVFTNRHSVGVWTFSSKEQGNPVDRRAEGPIIWHTQELDRKIVER